MLQTEVGCCLQFTLLALFADGLWAVSHAQSVSYLISVWATMSSLDTQHRLFFATVNRQLI